jgi:hypothetical protein
MLPLIKTSNDQSGFKRKNRLFTCLIAGLALLFLNGCVHTPPAKTEKNPVTNATNKSPLPKGPPVVGTFVPRGGDAGCWFTHRNMKAHGPIIFLYDVAENAEGIRMNINGKTVQLTEINRGKSTDSAHFKAGSLMVTLDMGSPDKHESPSCFWETFPNAKITVVENGLQTSVPAKGECGCSDP